MHTDLRAVGATVPPDLVARVARAVQEVAGGQVVDRDVVGLPDHDPVASLGLAVGAHRSVVLERGARAAASRGAGLGAVDDHGRTVHPADMDARRRDEHARRVAVRGVDRATAHVVGLVIVAGRDEDPVPGLRGVDRRLDGRVLPAMSLEGPDEEHPPAGRGGRGIAGRGAGGEQAAGEQADREQRGGPAPPEPCRPVRLGPRVVRPSGHPILSRVRRSHCHAPPPSRSPVPHDPARTCTDLHGPAGAGSVDPAGW